MTPSTFRSIVTRIATLLLVCGVSAPMAWAYQYKTCNGHAQTWDTDGRKFRRLRVSFPDGSTEESALYRASLNWWLYAPGSPFEINVAPTDNTWWGSGNGYNDIAFPTSGYSWSTGELAVCITYYKSCTFWFDEGGIRETDILFRRGLNWNFSWYPSGTDVNASNPGFVLVATHELGHALGLKHEDRFIATMNSYYPNGGPLGGTTPGAHAGDLNGARVLYGTHHSQRDVAASTFQRTSAGSSAPIPVPASVYRGTITAVPLTVSNRGTVGESSVVITMKLGALYPFGANVADLGTQTLSIGQGEWTVGNIVNFPTWLTPGTYILRGCVDSVNAIPESLEGNNCATYSTFTVVK